MEFIIKSGSPDKQRSACVVVGVYEPRRLSPAAELLDKASDGYLSSLLRRGDLEGKLGQTLLLHQVPNLQAERVLLVGCGKERELGDKQFRQLITKAGAVLNDTGSMEAVSYLTDLHVKGRGVYWKVRQAIEATLDSRYSFDLLKSKKDEARRPLRKITWNVPTRRDLTIGETAVTHAEAVTRGMELTRNVANLPPNICNPAYLAEQGLALAGLYPSISTEVVNEAQMAEIGMHSYLAVGRGSRNESLMTIIRYQGGQADDKPLLLVGKGLTFDSGGISIKPADGMDEMKYDMGGAAAVLGTMMTLAELQLPLNVIGILAGCENMPGGDSYRPGDILTTLSGQTVEVLNTDAEGRLVLCDVLTYVERFEPELVIDLATLTGACVIALGKHASGLMSPSDSLANKLLDAGSESGDRAWRLPLWDDYQEQLDSPFADMANVGGRQAGAITAGCFLARFTKKYTWAHLDIAGTAWRSGGKDKGSTGRPVAMLTQFLINRAGHHPES